MRFCDWWPYNIVKHKEISQINGCQGLKWKKILFCKITLLLHWIKKKWNIIPLLYRAYMIPKHFFAFFSIFLYIIQTRHYSIKNKTYYLLCKHRTKYLSFPHRNFVKEVERVKWVWQEATVFSLRTSRGKISDENCGYEIIPDKWR